MPAVRDAASDRAQIEKFIAERGITRCPAAAVAETSAELSTADRAAIAARFDAVGISWQTIKHRTWARRKASKGGAAIRHVR